MWDTNASLQDLVELGFIQQLRMSSLDRLELDGNLFSIGDVDAEVDVSKGSRPDLSDEPVFASHDELGT